MEFYTGYQLNVSHRLDGCAHPDMHLYIMHYEILLPQPGQAGRRVAVIPLYRGIEY